MRIGHSRRIVRLALALLLVSPSFILIDTSSPSIASGNSDEMFAYTSANNGRWSFKIQASDNPVVVTNVGDMGVTCGNMNLANNAGTKVYQSYNCNGSNKKFTEIDVATNTFQSFTVSERTHTMAISPDDRYMYFADPYYTFKFDLTTNPPTHVVGGSRDDNNAGINLGILPNGSKLYSASVQRSKVQVFNSSLALVATVTDPAFSSLRWALPNPSGTEVWVGFGSTYKIIDSTTDVISRTINASFGTASLPSFSPDGRFLYTSSGAGLEKVDTSTGLSVSTYTGTGLANGTHAAISPDGTYVYVANGSGVGWVNLTNSATGFISLPTTSPTESTKTIAWVRRVSPPTISISTNAISARVNSALGSSYAITNTGGDVASFSLSPVLPTGLVFNSTSGIISGTPSATFPITTYTLTATNAGGSSVANFSLEVTNPPAPTPSESAEPEIATQTSTNQKTQNSKTSSASEFNMKNSVANSQQQSEPLSEAEIAVSQTPLISPTASPSGMDASSGVTPLEEKSSSFQPLKVALPAILALALASLFFKLRAKR